MKQHKQFHLSNITSLTLILLLSCMLPVKAQWSTNPAVNNVICNAANSQGDPQIVSDGNGGAIIAWADFRSLNWNIYAQHISAAGINQWTSNGVVICSATNEQKEPAMIADGKGGAIITWHDKRGGTYYDIYAQRINASGVVQWTANGVAICTATSDQQYPMITRDSSFGAIITWQDNRSSSTGLNIYAQRIDSGGTIKWAVNGRAVCVAMGAQPSPTIVSDGVGGAYIGWEDQRTGVTTAETYLQRIGGNGVVKWAANGIPIASSPNAQSGPALVNDGIYGVVCAWIDSNPFTIADIYAQRVDSAGNIQWGSSGVVICIDSAGAAAIRMIQDGTGGGIMTWRDGRNGSLNDDVYAQRVNGSGIVQWTTDGLGICLANEHQDGRYIVADGNGGAIIAWDDFRSATYRDIYAQHVDASGNFLWTTNGITVSTASYDQLAPVMLADSCEVILAWNDYRGGSGIYSHVYAQKLNCTGFSSGTTQIHGMENTNSLTIFPNPSTGIITIPQNGIIEVYNLLGETVFLLAADKNENSINLEHLPKGTYLLRLTNIHGTLTKRIILE